MKKNDLKQQIGINALLIVLALLFLLPFAMIVSISLSDEIDIVYHGGYRLIPLNITLSSYRQIFNSSNGSDILQSYKVTAAFTVITMVFSVLLMSLLAYPLSRKAFKGRKQINFLLYFTMLFSGGLVPVYILNTQYLRLGDTIWIYILPALINPWYVFMMRTFFSQLPEEIHESAIMDGANEFYFLFKMMLPLSKPVLAAVALFTFLGKWNDWFTSMLYIDDQRLISLQYLLQRIMNNIKVVKESGSQTGRVTGDSETMRMAMAVIVAGPALLVFPFFQKYFVRGLTVGSVKG